MFTPYHAMEQSIIDSVKSGDVPTLRKLINDSQTNYDAELESAESNTKVTVPLDLSKVNDSSGNTLLHLAVTRCLSHPEKQNLEMLGILSNPEFNIDASLKNNEERTILHLFHGQTTSQDNLFVLPIQIQPPPILPPSFKRKYNMKNHKIVLTELMKQKGYQMVIDSIDDNGDTPLHLAVRDKCHQCIQILLKHQASFNIKSKHPFVPFMTPQIFQDPTALQSLQQRLNQKLIYAYDEASDSDDDPLSFGISFDFSDLVPKHVLESSKPEKEMEFLETFLNAPGHIKKQLLSHPLLAGFVFLKWERVRKLFVWSFLLHIALACLYTLYVYAVYMINCPYISTKHANITKMRNETRICDQGLGSFSFSITLLCVAVFLVILEGIKLAHNFRLRFVQVQTYLQAFLIVSICLSAWPVCWMEDNSLYNWQYSAAAYGMLNVWSTLLISMGSFPKLGIYIEMFLKVLTNFGLLMASYAFLLISFALTFCVVFPDYPPFETPLRAILKVITMMSGEVDLGFFYADDKKGERRRDYVFSAPDSSDLIHPITGHILFGAFVVLITVVLTNLLIGLAVDDIKVLGQNAEFTKTSREVSSIAYVESTLFWLPSIRIVRKLQESVAIGRLPSSQNGAVARKDSTLASRLAKTIQNMLPLRKLSGNEHKDAIQQHKYIYKITLDDETRKFPETIYLKAEEVIKKLPLN